MSLWTCSTLPDVSQVLRVTKNGKNQFSVKIARSLLCTLLLVAVSSNEDITESKRTIRLKCYRRRWHDVNVLWQSEGSNLYFCEYTYDETIHKNIHWKIRENFKIVLQKCKKVISKAISNSNMYRCNYYFEIWHTLSFVSRHIIFCVGKGSRSLRFVICFI